MPKYFLRIFSKAPYFPVQRFKLFRFSVSMVRVQGIERLLHQNRVKRHEKTFSLLVHTSSGQDPPIFSAANRLSTCVRHSRGLPARSFTTPRRQAVCCPPAELDGDCFCQFLCKAFPKKNEIQKGFAQPMYK